MPHLFKNVVLIGLVCAFEAVTLKPRYFADDPAEENVADEKPFKVVWNSPTGKCNDTFGIDRDVSKYGIVDNKEGSVDKIALLGGIGYYPYVGKDGHIFNGGIPQNVNLTQHLAKAGKDIEAAIPDARFSGLGVFDWESWRPLWSMDWDAKTVYRNLSEGLVRKEHPDWSQKQITDEAELQFNKAARSLMESTVQLAQKIRPAGRWGYYEFPDCYNYNGAKNCSPGVWADNDNLLWLFNASSALYPSTYLFKNINMTIAEGWVYGQIHEAERVRKEVGKDAGTLPIYPYSRYQHQDFGTFYTKDELQATIGQAMNLGIAGIVIWGDHGDCSTEARCQSQKNYIDEVLGPYVRSLLQQHHMNQSSESSISKPVITKPRMTDTSTNNFKVIWNSPTEGCEHRGIHLNLTLYNITVNTDDKFDGEQMILFYGGQIGLFPYVKGDGTMINGGIPQNVDISKHLAKAKRDIEAMIPDEDFHGCAVIDWESWRPLWVRNWDSMAIYRNLSEELVKKQHPHWSKQQIIAEAQRQFEEKARGILESTVKLGRQLRPGGKWGYYMFPQCYNHKDSNTCSETVQIDNNKLGWLFNASSGLYPSGYLYSNYNASLAQSFIHGEIGEALRVRAEVHRTAEDLPVYLYSRYQHTDYGPFYRPDDLDATIGQAKRMGIAGVVLWGDSADCETESKCYILEAYVDSVLGPYVKHLLG